MTATWRPEKSLKTPANRIQSRRASGHQFPSESKVSSMSTMRMPHPHIVGVHDRGEEDGQLWISTDFVDGLDAARLLAERYPAGMPVEEVAVSSPRSPALLITRTGRGCFTATSNRPTVLGFAADALRMEAAPTR